MNKRILAQGNLNIKRFFALDNQAYRKAALDTKTKELIGLAASTVLRCNDCITYHIIRCIQENATDQEIFETLNIALVIGGSITIPHLRRATEILNQCRNKQGKGQPIDL
jgi:AhpD family alkylhydroperoxidase